MNWTVVAGGALLGVAGVAKLLVDMGREFSDPADTDAVRHAEDQWLELQGHRGVRGGRERPEQRG